MTLKTNNCEEVGMELSELSYADLQALYNSTYRALHAEQEKLHNANRLGNEGYVFRCSVRLRRLRATATEILKEIDRRGREE